MNLLGKHRGRPGRARGRGRWRPELERLEVRQLLAASTVATTLDARGNPVQLAILAGGAVVANMDRATNDPSTPYRYSGEQSLPGLAASSIVGVTLPDGSPAAVATTGPESYLYLDRYQATGDPASPFAWTGWQQFGTFVATAVAAASDGASGSAIFAIGADTQVYEAPYDPSTTATAASTAWSGFQKLAGPGAASITALGDGASAYEVAALGGPQSYVEGNRVVVSGGMVQPKGWTQLGNFVASSINLTPGLNTNALGGSLGDRLFLFAAGGDGSLYLDPLTVDATTGDRDSTTYSSYGSPTGRVASSSAIIADGYMTLFALTTTGVVGEDQVVATGLTSDPLDSQGWQFLYSVGESSVEGIDATAMTTSPTADGGGDLLVTDSTGTALVNHLIAHPALGFPGYGIQYNQFAGYTSLSSIFSHPIATDFGPSGLPIVATLGSDGSVYAARDLAAGTSGAPDTYSAFAQLPGLTATSIAATREPNGFAVFALVGPQSSIYEDQYLPTGNATTPYAWTGWGRMGTLVATSIAAATPTNATSANQATVFGLGADGTIYAAGATPAGGDSTQATFTPLPGLAAAAFSVKAQSSQILVAALTGPQSYAYADLYSPPATVGNSGVATGWTVAGTFVLEAVAAGTDSTGKPIVAGVTTASSSNRSAVSLSLDGGQAPASNTSNYAYIDAGGFEDQNAVAVLTLPGSTAVGYLVFPTIETAVYLEPVVPGVVTSLYGSRVNGDAVTVHDFATSTGTFDAFYVSGEGGVIYVCQIAASGDPTNPLKASAYGSLGTLPT